MSEENQEVESKTYSEEQYQELKSKVDEFRNNNVALMKKQEDLENKFNGIDLEQYKELIKEKQEQKEQGLISEGKIEELLESRTKTMRDEHNATLEQMKNEQNNLNKRLEHLLIDNAVKDSAIKAGVLDTAIDDVILRSQTTFSIKDGQAVPHDINGNVIFADGTSEPMSVGQWVTKLKESAPHLFKGSTGSGSQHGNSFDGGQSTVTREAFEGMSHNQRAKFFQDGGKVVDA